MKKFNGFLVCIFFLLLLAMPAMSFAYDSSPSYVKVIPEAIWSAAAGGGIWTTEVQIYTRNTTNPVDLHVWFFDNAAGTMRGPFTLAGPSVQHMIRYTNILSTIDSLDLSMFDYYGRVGAIWFQCVDKIDTIQIQARTVHSGGYGKTMNGLDPAAAGNSAIFSPYRGLMIQNVYNGQVYRTSIGLFNASSSSISIRVALIDYNDVWLGSENITLPGYAFLSFNPFTRYSVNGTYTNCRFWVDPYAGSGKIMAFGANANNTTNDPSALIAVQYD